MDTFREIRVSGQRVSAEGSGECLQLMAFWGSTPPRPTNVVSLAAFPLVLTGTKPQSLAAYTGAVESARRELDQLLLKHGAILFRYVKCPHDWFKLRGAFKHQR
jgi:hypothetical protein